MSIDSRGELDRLVRTGIAEGSVQIEDYLEVLHRVGWAAWNAAVGAGDFEGRDVVLAMAAFAPLCDADPGSVPEPLLKSMPSHPRPGEPRVLLWVDLVGQLVRGPGEGDATCRLAAVAVLQLAVAMAMTPSEQVRCLGYLVTVLKELYRERNDLAVLDSAIGLARRGAELAAPGSEDRRLHLGSLCEALAASYEATGDVAGLDEAIECARENVRLCVPGEELDAQTNLGIVLGLRFGATGDSKALDEATDLYRRMARRLPPEHPAYARTLNNLARTLSHRPAYLSDPSLIEELIRQGREVVELAPEGSEVHAIGCANLANWLVTRSGLTGSVSDVDEGMRLANRALAGSSADARGTAWEVLAAGWDLRHRRDGRLSTLDQGLNVLLRALESTADQGKRATFTRMLGELYNNRYVITRTPGDAQAAVDALLRAARSTARVSTRTHCLWISGKLLDDLGRYPEAVDVLGEAVDLLPQLADEDLRAADRERQLQDLASLPAVAASCAIRAGRPERALRLLEAGRGILHSGRGARVVPDVRAAAANGPVVVLISIRDHAHALIVTEAGVSAVDLPQLTPAAVMRHGGHLVEGELANDALLVEGLAWLWEAAVGPVLARLGLTQVPPVGRAAPRVWWIPIGLLAHFPFHAAGRPGEAGAIDLVASSSAPDLFALLPGRQWQPGPGGSALVVGLPQTPGLADLPAVDEEIGLLAEQLPGAALLRGHSATREAVLAGLADRDVVHFACHGGNDPRKQYEAFLSLHDGPLRLGEIAARRSDRGGLAFLSACGTARHRLGLEDQALNLATAFQVAGFTHVVGSLWPVGDRAALLVVRRFYAELLGSASGDPASALRAAVLELRRREPRPTLWAPFIHVGR